MIAHDGIDILLARNMGENQRSGEFFKMWESFCCNKLCAEMFKGENSTLGENV